MQYPDPRWESDDLPVLMAVYEWERDRQEPSVLGIAEVATQLGRPVLQVAKSIHYLVLGGYLSAHDVTSMGAVHYEYLIEGVTSQGLRACRVWPGPNADVTEAVLRAIERQDPGVASRLREVAKTAGTETLKVLVETAVRYGSGTLIGH